MSTIVCINYAEGLRRLVRKASSHNNVDFIDLGESEIPSMSAVPLLFLADAGASGVPPLDVVRELRSTFPSCPLILTTTLGDDAALAKWALRARVSDYVALPYEIDYLTNCVRRWADRVKGQIETRRIVFHHEGLGGTPVETGEGAVAGPKTQPAIEIIGARFAEKLPIRALAAACCMSEEAFRRQFKLEHGETLRNYLKNCRMGEALKMLEVTTLSVQEIAHLVGYDDPSLFNRLFKSVYGSTPLERRNASRPKDHAGVQLSPIQERKSSSE